MRKENGTITMPGPVAVRENANTNVTPIQLGGNGRANPSSTDGDSLALPTRDVLTELLRDGAHRLLALAIDAEVTDWIERHAAITDENDRQQVVRNGHHPTRTPGLQAERIGMALSSRRQNKA